MAPKEVLIQVPALHRTLVFSDPAYLAESAEDTPYQWLRLCDESGRNCRTLLDARGRGGVAMPASKRLGLSPDGRYLLCFRLSGVDADAARYRGQAYELYDLAQAGPVTFNSSTGRTATTDNIQGWSRAHPHALTLSVSPGKTELAFPPDEN